MKKAVVISCSAPDQETLDGLRYTPLKVITGQAARARAKQQIKAFEADPKYEGYSFVIDADLAWEE